MHATIVEVEQSAEPLPALDQRIALAVLHRLIGRHEQPVADTSAVRSPCGTARFYGPPASPKDGVRALVTKPPHETRGDQAMAGVMHDVIRHAPGDQSPFAWDK